MAEHGECGGDGLELKNNIRDRLKARKTNTYRSDTNFLTGGINLVKVVVHGIEGMYGIRFSTETESDVERLLTRYHPELLIGIIVSAFDTTIDLVRDVTRNLRKCKSGILSCERQNIRGYLYSPTVNDGDELAVGASRDDRIDLERLTVRTNDSSVFVSQNLPMLIWSPTTVDQFIGLVPLRSFLKRTSLQQSVYFVDIHLGHRGDILEARHDFGNGKLALHARFTRVTFAGE